MELELSYLKGEYSTTFTTLPKSVVHEKNNAKKYQDRRYLEEFSLISKLSFSPLKGAPKKSNKNKTKDETT